MTTGRPGSRLKVIVHPLATLEAPGRVWRIEVMLAPWAVLQQVLSSRGTDEDAVALATAAFALAAAIACVVFGVRFFRRKRTGLAVVLFLAGAMLLFACLGISALIFIAQFAWH